MSAYDLDTYAWANEQADALRRRSANEIDWDNVAEEIESVGKSEKRELSSRLEVLVMHLLKWRHQPEGRGSSWELTIVNQRDAIAEHLAENPSLKPQLPEIVGRLYARARRTAAEETGLPLGDISPEPPFSIEELLAEAFWPERPSSHGDSDA